MFRNLVIVVLVALLGAAGFYYYQSGTSPTTDAAEQTAPPEGYEDPVLEPVAETMVFSRLQVDVANDNPEACLVFSQDLDESGATNYSDYLVLDPSAKPSTRIAGPLLCLGGLAFNQTYTVTIREGLPAASGIVTAYDERVPVELRDRPAAVAFGSGIILPRESGGSVPITTINVDTVSLRVLRVGDRLLARLEQGLLDQTQLYGYNASEIENSQGSLIWEGDMDVDRISNEAVTTRFPIAEILADEGVGAYVILAKDGSDGAAETEYWRGTASQWIIETDIGLTTFWGNDGVRVFARSLEDATSMAGVELRLIARNNEVLGTRRTGTNGAVAFEAGLVRGTGGMEPVAVMAYGREGDFAFLDLRRPAFDLSDRGVSGRTTPGPIDAYLYTERGVYRPGETVELVTLLRNEQSDALEDVPLSIVVRRPDGMEVVRETFGDQDAGALHLPVTLSQTAALGMWRASAYIDTDAAAVGQVQFEVQNFVPERLEVTATPAKEILRAGDDVRVEVRARFLYGAPAAGLNGEAELRLEKDHRAFEGYEEFSFGRVEEALDAALWPLSLAPTDREGATVATGSLAGLPSSTWPLLARARIGVYEPGGRATQAIASMSVRTRDLYLGIRPAFEGRYVRRNTAAAFEIVSLDGQGQRTALENVSWQIVREVVNYQWYEVDGDWRFERITQDRPIAAGSLSTQMDQLAEVSDTLSWGTYRVIVEDESGETSSSQRFYVGWWGAASADRPDELVVTSEAESYLPGATAQVTIRPSLAGPALVVVANDHVLETRQIDVPADGMTIDLDVSEDWGGGAYVLVTHYRALSDGEPRAPVRSVGLTWVEVDTGARELEVAINAPEVVAPQQTITVPVQVSNLSGERAWLTLAAVDQGILQLTQYASPNPEDHYFGKRRLGVDMRDDYGRLIQDTSGTRGTIRSGGDSAFGGAALTVVPTRTVALFSGLIELDAQGRGEVELVIPDFVGELRLMAVAVSQTKVGQADQPLTIRDALVGELSLPRFLAPGDTAQATLSLHNVAGPAGRYEANISTGGPLLVEGGDISLSLAEGERQEVAVMLSASEIGIGTVQLDLSGPGGVDRTRHWPLQVRAAQMPETREEVAIFGGGTSYQVPTDSLVGLIPATANVSLALSTTRGLDTGGLLRALDRYPYGCLEQSVSRAFPLMFYKDMAAEANMETEDGEAIEIRIQNAVNRVLDMQRTSGAFGMWGYRSDEADSWLSLYAIDFLLAADDQGYIVPDDALRRGLSWASSVSTQSWRDNPVRAYAFYLVATHGNVVPGDLRYFHDTLRAGMSNVLALSHMGGALDAMGDRARGAASFDQALRLAVTADANSYEPYRYGSLTRDVAGLTALAAMNGRLTLLPSLFDRIDELAPRLAYTTTQEKSWLLFAAMALRISDAELDVSVEGASILIGEDPVMVTPSAAEVVAGVSAANAGEDIWRTLTRVGVPEDPQAASAEGLVLTRSIFNLDGTAADLDGVRQNDRLVVLIQGRMNDNYAREMAVMDLLPAGFEIETLLSPGAQPWLPGLTSTRMAEARDDRFVAAFDVGNRYRPTAPDSEGRPIRPRFAVAYQVRAITPGTFVQPPTYVEDMYMPRVRARTDMGHVTIRARN